MLGVHDIDHGFGKLVYARDDVWHPGVTHDQQAADLSFVKKRRGDEARPSRIIK